MGIIFSLRPNYLYHSISKDRFFLSIILSIYLSIYHYLSRSICLTIYLSIYQSILYRRRPRSRYWSCCTTNELWVAVAASNDTYCERFRVDKLLRVPLDGVKGRVRGVPRVRGRCRRKWDIGLSACGHLDPSNCHQFHQLK